MNYLRRIIAALLGVTSPSRIMRGSEPRTWLERWERKIDARIGWPPVIGMREEVLLIEPPNNVVARVDVTGRSDRAQRRVRNTWRRRRPDLEVKLIRTFE